VKPVCVTCQRFFQCIKTGYYFIEAMPAPGSPRRPEPGTAHPEHWQPYKLWVSDLWTCEGCGAQILSGFGREPLAEHYQPDFADMAARVNATLQVNDC
jgi:hypothetical protein